MDDMMQNKHCLIERQATRPHLHAVVISQASW